MRHIYIVLVLVLFGCKDHIELTKSLSDRIEILENENVDLLISFEQEFALNQVKSQPFYEKANYINSIIEELKKEIEMTDKINSELVEKLEHCFLTIQSFYWEKEQRELNLMKERQSYFKIQFTLGRNLTDESKLFLILDLQMIKSQIIRHLLSQIDKYDYKFNFIRPIVIENQKVLKLGETYKAKIITFATDTTTFPIFIIEGDTIEVWNGYGIYELNANKVGNFEWKGTMKYYNMETDKMEDYPISGSFKVK